jgi:hypothetical protein
MRTRAAAVMLLSLLAASAACAEESAAANVPLRAEATPAGVPVRAGEATPASVTLGAEDATTVNLPLRLAIQTEAASGIVTGRFYNQLVGLRLDAQFSPRVSFGG